eukprot:XP_025984859.1 F-box/kelch-repeat protein At3g61590-like [Glycine max]
MIKELDGWIKKFVWVGNPDQRKIFTVKLHSLPLNIRLRLSSSIHDFHLDNEWLILDSIRARIPSLSYAILQVKLFIHLDDLSVWCPTENDESTGYAYYPTLRKWYGIELPLIETSNWFIASSYGLVCFMNNDNKSKLRMCNPITKSYRNLDEPPALESSDYNALAMPVNRKSHSYNVAIVKSKQIPEDFVQWGISIHIYDSKNETWMTTSTEVLMGWRGGNESVILNGVLYFLVYSVGGVSLESHHALLAYNISYCSSQTTLRTSFIDVPYSLTCGRLMNMNEKLVMVGGIDKHDRPCIIKGVGIWVLNDRNWEKIVRMPHKYFQGFNLGSLMMFLQAMVQMI